MKNSGAVAEEKISRFIERSKELGLKVTPQRIAIYRELVESFEHPSTEMIYKSVKSRYPNISLTTVYRTLETFEKTGLVSVVNTLYHAARYDANLDPHHHVVCVRCKKIEDIYDDSASYSKLDPEIDGYKVLGYSVLFSGICGQCSGRDA